MFIVILFTRAMRQRRVSNMSQPDDSRMPISWWSGGAGFVGSNLVHQLLAQGHAPIHMVDNLISSEMENVPVHAGRPFHARFDRGRSNS